MLIDGYENFVNLFLKLLENEEHVSKHIKLKYSKERKVAEKYTYRYIIENIDSVDLNWIKCACERLWQWKARKNDKKYIAGFLLELLTGIGNKFLQQDKYDRAYEMMLMGQRIRCYCSVIPYDRLIEKFYRMFLESSEQRIGAYNKREYLEKGKELLTNSNDNKLKTELIIQLADEYRAIGWNNRFERLYKEATSLGNTISREFFTNLGISALVDYGKLLKWLGNEEVVLIPDSVTEIGKNAFCKNCFAYKVIIPNTVRKIDSHAFAECENLVEVEIQGYIEVIGSGAFAGCKNLSKIIFGQNPKYIESDAFDNTAVLNYSNSVLTVGRVLVGYKGKTDTVHIQEGIEQIGANAFANAEIVSVVLPDTLRTIGRYGFSGCRNLRTVVLPDTVRTIDDYAFRSSGVREISLGSVEKIGKGSFENSEIESVRIPGTVDVIENSLFEYCTTLKEVGIGIGVRKIGKNAFWGCDKLTKVYIPHTVIEIDSNAFEEQQMMICGAKNSYACQYAKKRGMRFIAVKK